MPCRFTFTGKEVDISKVEKLLNCGNQAIKPVDVAGAVENPSDFGLL